MRGAVSPQDTMVSALSRGPRVCHHPILASNAQADEALARPSAVFDQRSSRVGRPSLPPERLLKAERLLALSSVRSRRLFCERLDSAILRRWFLDRSLDDPGVDLRTFGQTRDRLLTQ